MLWRQICHHFGFISGADFKGSVSSFLRRNKALDLVIVPWIGNAKIDN